MRILIDLLYLVLLILLSPVWLWKLLTTGKWRTNWVARLGFCWVPPDPHAPHGHHRPTLLLHAVSVGEVNALRQLVELIEETTQNKWRIIISSTTNTGLDRAKELYSHKHTIVRYPLDFSLSVKFFLKRVSPDLVALAELEVWPNFVARCRKSNIPVCVVNGRLSARSFKRYKIFSNLLRPTFEKLAAVAVQTEEYAQRFMHLGVRSQSLAVMDSMKWDTAQMTPDVQGSDALAKAMGIDRSRPIVVAGSTAPGEDKLLIDSVPADVQLVLVPRKPEWFSAVVKLAPDIVKRSEHRDDQPPRAVDGQRLFLLDTMGELRKAYALADVCVVGRSFLGLYGSDMIEPIALGKPTVIGPFHSDFADIMFAFVDAQGIIMTKRPGLAVKELLAEPALAKALAQRGQQVILRRRGSTRRHVELLMRLMPLHAANTH